MYTDRSHTLMGHKKWTLTGPGISLEIAASLCVWTCACDSSNRGEGSAIDLACSSSITQRDITPGGWLCAQQTPPHYYSYTSPDTQGRSVCCTGRKGVREKGGRFIAWFSFPLLESWRCEKLTLTSSCRETTCTGSQGSQAERFR